ncbi:hypothetical protein MSAN_00836000 [Mycena sanguinolenta]|uniref:Uncharacterized protein n=1 Tax=Mycena sanguinolenta TaxID=230812 RepID=A0A8H7DCE1_9AGAR|nr:hypothetical protein MSAN_00836000 [Mycena sanguinolenta]
MDRVLHRVYRQIASYKLGYSPQRPYPWRWTTPISFSVFLVVAGALAVINVPLSAYELNQVSTFRPNDTLPSLPFYNLIPKILQHSTDSFTPHILTMGDTITLNLSLFDWTIWRVFDQSDNPTQTPSAFSYYNNPFSDGCDIASIDHCLLHSLFKLLIHLQVRMRAIITLDSEDQQVQLSIVVFCRIPTSFGLSWTGTASRLSEIIPRGTNLAFNDLRNFVYNLRTELASWYQSLSTPGSTGRGQLTVFVAPCCNCGTNNMSLPRPSGDENLLPAQRPCSSLPVVFKQIAMDFSCALPGSDPVYGKAPETGISLIDSIAPIAPESICLAPNTPMADLSALLQNIFQSLYHIVRLDLGLVLDNQIYLFPEMYNRSILPVHDPNPYLRPPLSKGAFTETWLESMRIYTQIDRVPIFPYLRPVPRLKPRASALTSVFVSTFAMLSVLWTIFNVIAGAMVPSSTGDANTPGEQVTEPSESSSHVGRDLENQTLSVELEELNSSKASVNELDPVPKELLLAMLERLNANSDRMERSLQRVILSLERHGILEDAREAASPGPASKELVH